VVNGRRVHWARAELFGVDQVLVPLPVAQIERQGVVDVLEADRERVDVSALAVNGEHAGLEVDVGEPNPSELVLPKPEVGEQHERDLLPQRRLRRDQSVDVLAAQEVAHLPLSLRRPDVLRRVGAQEPFAD
jgi:hypothetical protein